jgi:hypothetical protein
VESFSHPVFFSSTALIPSGVAFTPSYCEHQATSEASSTVTMGVTSLTRRHVPLSRDAPAYQLNRLIVMHVMACDNLSRSVRGWS